VLAESNPSIFEERKEVIKMKKRIWVISLAVALVVAFGLVALAQDVVKGKVEALNKDAKKITISGTEYSLSADAAQAKVAVGDQVEATVEGKVVKKLTKKEM
jgi:cell division protein FtsB